MSENFQVVRVDYHNPEHASALVELLNAYALDPMGGGIPLTESTRCTLVTKLAQLPNAFSLIGYLDQQPVALANCFEAFSTFRNQPLLNVHDFAILPAWRGRGFSQQLLAAIEQLARARGCCKITLEVLEGNQPARAAYARFGFDAYLLDPQKGKALFWQKLL